MTSAGKEKAPPRYSPCSKKVFQSVLTDIAAIRRFVERDERPSLEARRLARQSIAPERLTSFSKL